MVLEHLAILVVVSKASKVFWSISNLILAVPLLQPDRVEGPLELVDLQEAVDRRRYRQTACEHRSQRGSGTPPQPIVRCCGCCSIQSGRRQNCGQMKQSVGGTECVADLP